MSGVPARLKIVINMTHPWRRRPYEWEIWDLVSGRPLHTSYTRYRTIGAAHAAAMFVLQLRWGRRSDVWVTYPHEYRRWTRLSN